MSSSKHKLRRADTKQLAEMDLDQLLALLSPEELEELENMVDPDDSDIPAHQRCRSQTKKAPTGPLDRKKLLNYIEKMAKEEEDWPEEKPFQAGVKRGKVWVPKDEPKIKTKEEEDLEYELDLGDEYESALAGASEAELVDLAAILGLHSMLNQEQYYASLLNKGQKLGDKFESAVRAYQPKSLPLLPDNDTDVEKTIEQVEKNDSSLKNLNWNNIKLLGQVGNFRTLLEYFLSSLSAALSAEAVLMACRTYSIKNITKEQFKRLFKALGGNTNLKTLCVANTGLTDSSTEVLIEALKENKTLIILNVESNYISGPMAQKILAAINVNQTVLEYRAANQGNHVLGNQVEMEMARLIEENNTILCLGIHFEMANACMRITEQLQKNYDKIRVKRVGK